MPPLKQLFRFQSLRKARSNLTQVTLAASDCLPFHSSSEAEQRGDLVVSKDFGTEVMIRQRDAATLMELAQHEESKERHDEAMDCFKQALDVVEPETELEASILWNLLSLSLQQQQSSSDPSSSLKQRNQYYLTRLRPHFQNKNLPSNMSLLQQSTTQTTTTSTSSLLLDYIVEQKEWDGAIQLAHHLKVEPELMAQIHYEYGIQSTVPKSQRMDCMSKCLSFCSSTTSTSGSSSSEGEATTNNNNRLKLAAHGELVQLHLSAGNYLQAMKHHEERLGMLENSTDIVKAFYEEGEIYVGLGHSEKAMSSLEKGIALYPDSLTLLQAKADLLYLNGKLTDAMELHEQVLMKTTDASQQTKILYTLGRICCKTRKFHKAQEYYQRELILTQEVFGAHHLECSRVYHELARLEDDAFLNYPKALEYLELALAIETKCLEQEVSSKKKKKEIGFLIMETNKLIGRIYYKMGDFSKALTTSFGQL